MAERLLALVIFWSFGVNLSWERADLIPGESCGASNNHIHVHPNMLKIESGISTPSCAWFKNAQDYKTVNDQRPCK